MGQAHKYPPRNWELRAAAGVMHNRLGRHRAGGTTSTQTAFELITPAMLKEVATKKSRPFELVPGLGSLSSGLGHYALNENRLPALAFTFVCRLHKGVDFQRLGGTNRRFASLEEFHDFYD